MKRKKPEGYEWQNFVENWMEASHQGKLELAQTFGITYETARHWISDSGAGQERERQRVSPLSVAGLLASTSSIKLDIVCFDLETSELKADFAVILTACIKPFGQNPQVFRADVFPEWQAERANDSRITKAISDELRKHAIVVGHYSSKFDIPFLRAKMVKHGLLPLPLMFGIDTWRIARGNFQVSSRRLKNLADYFSLGEKELVEGNLWMEAAYNGSKEAMDRIVEHNIKDVEILERLACLSFPYLKSIPKL